MHTFLPGTRNVAIPLAARSKAWVCGCRLLGLRIRIPAGTWPSLVNAVSFQVEVSVTDRSPVQGSPTENKRDREGVCVCVFVIEYNQVH